MCWYGECSCVRQWKQPFILDQIIWRTWKSTRTRTSTKFRVYSISHRIGASWTDSECAYDREHISWTRSTLSRDQVIQWTKAKVRVCADSVLCLVKMFDNRDAIVRWEGQVEEFKMSASYTELLGIDENQLNSSGTFSRDFRHCRFFRKIQNDFRERNIELEKFTDRIIFMSMFNDIDWTRKWNDGICFSNSEKVKTYAKRFSQGQWAFLCPGDEKKWYGTLHKTPEGKWDTTATQMVERFKDTGHPEIKSISALSRGILKKRITETPYTSTRMLQTPSSYSE